MSHNPTYRVFDYSENIKEIENGLRAFVERECYEEGGTLDPIRWLKDRVFTSYDEAIDWLKETDRGWYDNRAVVFKSYDGVKVPKRSSKYESLLAKSREVYSKLIELQREDHFKNLKIKNVTCKTCRSVIPIDRLMGRNNCPVCGYSLLPQSKQNKIEEFTKKLSDINKQIEAENRLYSSRLGAIRIPKENYKWLVYFDYHT